MICFLHWLCQVKIYQLVQTCQISDSLWLLRTNFVKRYLFQRKIEYKHGQLIRIFKSLFCPLCTRNIQVSISFTQFDFLFNLIDIIIIHLNSDRWIVIERTRFFCFFYNSVSVNWNFFKSSFVESYSMYSI